VDVKRDRDKVNIVKNEQKGKLIILNYKDKNEGILKNKLIKELLNLGVDIDLGVEASIFEDLRKREFKIYTFNGDTEVLVYDDFIDVHYNHGEQYVIIDGVGCWTLQEVLKLKERLNRPKDQKDIKKIKDYLKKKESKLKKW
jgi:hypothetical protein